MTKRTALLFLLSLLLSCKSEQDDTSLNKNRVPKERKHRKAKVVDALQNKSENSFIDLSEYSPAATENGDTGNQLSSHQNIEKDKGALTAKKNMDKSSSQNNRPLYVIDGVPMDDIRKASTGRWGATEYKKTIDIDSLNVDSIRVLIGKKAVELYGKRGKNGVVLFTTQKGQSNISYIKSSGDTTYSREDAASKGMLQLLKKQNDEQEDSQ